MPMEKPELVPGDVHANALQISRLASILSHHIQKINPV
jgi:hypothetical protein